MDFEVGGDNVRTGGGTNNALLGLLAGTALNRDNDRDGRSMTWFAMVIVLIVFFIAIIFLALAFKEGKGHERVHSSGNYGELLATMVAAKGFEGNNKGYEYDHDHLEIKNQIAHSEDRREISGIKSELGAVALMMQKTASDNEKENLNQFGEIKQQLGALNMGMTQVLQQQNNSTIINGVIQQLMYMPCKPC